MVARLVAVSKPLVVGLSWRQVTLSAGSTRADVLKAGRALKPVRIHAPKNGSVLGLLAAGDLDGQRLPRKCWSASAMFASLSDVPRTALLALALPRADGSTPVEAALIAVQDGVPLPDYDLVVGIDDVADVGAKALTTLERLVGDRPEAFGALVGGTPIEWEDIAQRGTVGALTAPTSSGPMTLVAVLALLGGGLYMGWDWWQAEQRRQAAVEAARTRVDPNIAYGQSVASALGATLWLGPKQIEQLVAAVGRIPTEIGGFRLDVQAGVECSAKFECSASYKRHAATTATYADFAKALVAGMFTKVQYGIDGDSVSAAFLAGKPAPGTAPSVDSLWAEGDLPRRVWPILQRLESLPATAKLRPASGAPVGVVPAGATEADLKTLVRIWPVDVTLPAWAADATPDLPGLTWDKAVIRLQSQPTLQLNGRLHAVRK